MSRKLLVKPLTGVKVEIRVAENASLEELKASIAAKIEGVAMNEVKLVCKGKVRERDFRVIV